MRRRWTKLLAGVLAAAALTATGCGATANNARGSDAKANITLTGAGSTFDWPLFDTMFKTYHRLHPEVSVNYQAIGSGGGQRALFDGTVQFAASDAFLSDDDLAKHSDLVHIPITIGAVSLGYNLPGVTDLRLTGPVLADIYLGKIKTWNDPAIAALNPGTSLPNTPVLPVYRSDGSGTTFIFTNYLKAVSTEWASQVGADKSVSWPVGVGGKGSDGVAGQVKQTPGAIGYFEMAYAVQNDIPQATLQNRAGSWVAPSADGASAAAADAASSSPSDLRMLIVDAPGPPSYPISGFSWVLVSKNLADTPSNRALAELLWWMVHDGQGSAKPLNYAPLPDPIVKLDEAVIRSVGAGGTSLVGR